MKTTGNDVTGRALPRPPLRRQPALMRQLLSDPRPALDALRDSWGPIVGLGAGPMSLAIVGEPSAMRELFAENVESFRWNHRFNVLEFVVGRTSMIVSDGPEWKRRRSAVQMGFSRKRLNGWIPQIIEATDRAVERVLAGTVASNSPVDLDDHGRVLVQEIVVRALFGPEMAQQAAHIAGLLRGAQEYLESPFVRQLPHPLPVGRRARVRRDLTKLRALIDERIRHLRRAPEDDPLDVLAAMVSAGELTDEEIRDQVVSLLGAGLDTTSATLAWMLWCATAPAPAPAPALDAPGLDAHGAGKPGPLWLRLRAEADEVLGNEMAWDATHLGRLEFAHRLMRETTRLHPAGSISPRMAHRDIVVGGYRIPRGTLILWSPFLAGRDPNTWVDPTRFDPDRYLGLTPAQQAATDAAWAPFGGGARNCIGFALAQMELVLGIARLAQRLDVTRTAARFPDAVGMVVNRPVGGTPMHVRPRVS